MDEPIMDDLSGAHISDLGFLGLGADISEEKAYNMIEVAA